MQTRACRLFVVLWLDPTDCVFSSEEVDDETKEWEDEQLRRSGLSMDQTTVSAKQVYVPTPSEPLTPDIAFNLTHPSAFVVPMVTPIPTLDPAVEQLTRAMTSLTQSHAQNTATLASLGAEQVELENKDNEMRELITAAESKRSWFVAFRDWVESVAAFLDEKVSSFASRSPAICDSNAFTVSSS